MRKNTKLEEIIKEYEKYQFLYIYGMAGVGKTTTILEFKRILEEKENQVLYFDMADSDNEQKAVEHIICQDYAAQKEKNVILDNFHAIENSEITAELASIMTFNKTKAKIIFVSRVKPPEILNENIYKERVKIINGQWPLFDKRDMLDLLYEKEIKINREQMDKIYSWSEGHPEIALIALHVMKQDVEGEKLEYIATHPMITEYIKNNIWDYLSEEQKEVCREVAYYPYMYNDVENLGDKYWVIKELKEQCILMMSERSEYASPIFLRDFMTQNGIIKKADKDILDKIGEWMQKKGRFKNALECYYKSGNVQRHRECMKHAYDKVFWLTDSELLKKYLDFSMKEENLKEALYLKGMLLINNGEIEKAERIINKLSRIDTETYLNLLYYYPQITIKEWMDEAEKKTEETGKIRIYSLNGSNTGCLGSVKDMSELFCHKKKDIEECRLQWNRIAVKEQRDFFTLAEIEYLMETNRMAEAARLLVPFLVSDKDMDEGKREVLFGILCNMYTRGYIIIGYEDLLESYFNILKLSESEAVVRNVISQKKVYDIWNKSNSASYKVFFENGEEDYEKVDKFNCFYLFYKAKNYLFTKQYEKAAMLFARLYSYFGEYNQYRFQAESGMGKAVAEYDMNNDAEALKILTVTLSIVEKYRYVGIFSLYGDPGKSLLNKYCETSNPWNGNGYSYNLKKNYYYGNVLGVSFENYLKVLVRAVKKNAPRYPYNREESLVEYETLTATEISILQYIEQGYSNSQIAEAMNIKLTTVKKHVYNIYKKLDVSSRIQAVQKGKVLGILVR